MVSKDPIEDRVGDGLTVRRSGYVAFLLFAGMAGGVATLLGELLDHSVIAISGLTVMLAGSVAAGAFAVLDSRHRGVTVRRSLWDGLRTIVSWVGFLF